jgi:hypothetical protein
VRILSPLQSLPDIEVMQAYLLVRRDTVRARGVQQQIMQWSISAAAYFTPLGDGEVVMPFHRCQVRATFQGSDLVLPFDKIHIGPEMRWEPIPTVSFTPLAAEGSPQDPKPVPSELVVRSPSRLLLTSDLGTKGIALPSGDAELTARLGVVWSEQDLTVRWSLSQIVQHS